MAERLLGHALAAEQPPLNRVPVVSAGVSAFYGDMPSQNSIRALQKVGIDLDDHRSRPVSQYLLDQSAVVLCMTESHLRLIEALFEPLPPHLYLFRHFTDSEFVDVPDPFGGSLQEYEACRDALVEAVPGLLQFLREHADVFELSEK